MLLDNICVLPQNNAPVQRALIMLHGYGANGHDLISLAPFFQKDNPNMIFYAPNAPFKMDAGGYKWYSLDDMADETVLEQADYIERLMYRAKEQIELINTFISLIKEKHKLADNHIALMGFSQGGLLALMTGLLKSSTLNCLIGCSSVPLSINKALSISEVLSFPDTLLTHGEDDESVPFLGMEMTQNTLKNIHIHVTTHVVPGMGHSIDNSCINAISKFLKDHSNIK